MNVSTYKPQGERRSAWFAIISNDGDPPMQCLQSVVHENPDVIGFVEKKHELPMEKIEQFYKLDDFIIGKTAILTLDAAAHMDVMADFRSGDGPAVTIFTLKNKSEGRSSFVVVGAETSDEAWRVVFQLTAQSREAYEFSGPMKQCLPVVLTANSQIFAL